MTNLKKLANFSRCIIRDVAPLICWCLNINTATLTNTGFDILHRMYTSKGDFSCPSQRFENRLFSVSHWKRDYKLWNTGAYIESMLKHVKSALQANLMSTFPLSHISKNVLCRTGLKVAQYAVYIGSIPKRVILAAHPTFWKSTF